MIRDHEPPNIVDRLRAPPQQKKKKDPETIETILSKFNDSEKNRQFPEASSIV